MFRKIFFGFIIAFWVAAFPAIAADSEKEKAAIFIAEQWLLQVDAGKYESSWQAAALILRQAIPPEDWERSLKAARVPLGKLVSRKVKSATYLTTLPGAPDGEYVVIVFETSFENKKIAIETITPMREKDGQWRVSGYYIK